MKLKPESFVNPKPSEQLLVLGGLLRQRSAPVDDPGDLAQVRKISVKLSPERKITVQVNFRVPKYFKPNFGKFQIKTVAKSIYVTDWGRGAMSWVGEGMLN